MAIIYSKREPIELPEETKVSEFYETPKELVEKVFYDLRSELVEYMLPGAMCAVIDAGAGTGVWGKAFKEVISDKSHLIGFEIRDIPSPECYDVWYTANYLNSLVEDSYEDSVDVVIGNPPFKHAEEFINRSLSLLRDGGHLVFLLRLSFLESRGRFERLWANGLNPKLVLACAPRVKFYGNSSNDTAYAVYVWQKGYEGKTELDWITWEYEK